MGRLEERSLRVVFYEGPGSAPLEDANRFALLSALLDAGYEVTRLGDGEEGRVSSVDSTTLLVLGRFAKNEPLPSFEGNGSTDVLVRNITGLATEEVLECVRQARKSAAGREPDPWKPWFPVIDYDRCTNCMQCLSFCLFDVYGVGAKEQIQVTHADHCKTDCPACSRVCPEVAILFPKYGKGPINGDAVREEDIQREAMKVDISALLGGNIYDSLRTRNQNARKRFSTERDESRALLERKRCLKKLKVALDVPDEVLMSLPSVESIAERTERARAKAAKRMSRSQTVRDQQSTASQEQWGI